MTFSETSGIKSGSSIEIFFTELSITICVTRKEVQIRFTSALSLEDEQSETFFFLLTDTIH